MRKHILSDWEKVVDEGFGNKHNMCTWSMIKYKDHLYAGTFNFVNGCQVYRSKTGDKGTWKQVNIDGFDRENKSLGARTMIVYKDLLWIATISGWSGTQIWVTNGEDDDKDEMVLVIRDLLLDERVKYATPNLISTLQG